MTDSTEQKHTEITTFEPTAKMLTYLDTAVEFLTDSPTKITGKCEIARRTWYDWLKVEGFEDWFYEQYKKRRTRIIPKLDEIGMTQAEKGSYPHWEALNRKVDDLPEKGTRAGVSVDDGEKIIKLVLDIPKG